MIVVARTLKESRLRGVGGVGGGGQLGVGGFYQSGTNSREGNKEGGENF